MFTIIQYNIEKQFELTRQQKDRKANCYNKRTTYGNQRRAGGN